MAPRLFRHLGAALLAASVLCPPVLAATPEQRAEAALKAAPVWDGHNDVPIQLRGRYQDAINDFDFADTTDTADPDADDYRKRAMHTDLARLRKGHVGAQFWSVYVSADLEGDAAVKVTLEQIDVAKRLVARYPDDLMLATSSADVERAIKQGRIASLFGMEGGHSIGGSLGVLRQMYAQGVRYMTLTHSRNTSWADSASEPPEHNGLTDFGRDVVREMNRLGMLVDLSHVSDETMLDALEVSRVPVIFSHSGARAVNGHERNVPDAVLDRLKDNGGIVMAIALPDYVSEELRQWRAAKAGEEARLKTLFPANADSVKQGLADWEAQNPTPDATVSQVADHIDHIVGRIGIDHVGIGGDYDGMPHGPEGMEDVSGYPALFAELVRRGYSQGDLEKIASRNMMRVLKQAERYAAAHRGDLPIEYPVGK
ncbi:MAG: dipeptidase [Novosphingobium sp.]|nr:dipeptidase [Novosphingobium sp.]